MVTRKDFEQAAERVRDIYWHDAKMRACVAAFLADWFIVNNPSFRRDWFMRACGL